MEISPADITIQSLRAGAFKNAFPLWYSLNDLVEVNMAHDHQGVLDHTLGVLTALEENFRLEFVQDPTHTEKLRAYLQDTPDMLSRQTLIFLATVFHDIGKIQTLGEVSPGVFSCPGHEAVSAGIAREYLEEIELTTREKNWIVQFILLHGYVHGVLSAGLLRKDRDFFRSFHTLAGDMTAGLLLFVDADDKGSDLQQLASDVFHARAKKIQEMIGWWSDETV